MKPTAPIVTLKEKVDEEVLLKLLASSKITKEQKEMLYKYRKLIKEGYVSVGYNYSQYISKGRLFAKGLSYQGITRNIRHTLAHHIYDDIDMVNAAPTMMQQYCKKNNIPCPMLTRYVTYRDKWLKEIMEFHNIDRNRAKKLILRLMYLGRYRISTENLLDEYDPEDDREDNFKPEGKVQKVVQFSKELKTIANSVYNIEKDIVAHIEGNEYYKNKKASALCILSQVLESENLNHAINFFKMQGYKIGTLCFDGFMIEKKKIEDDLLVKCSNYVNQKSGYKIKFEVKKMDELIELPPESALVRDDKDVQEKLFRLIDPSYFKYCQGSLYIFSTDTGMYEQYSKDNSEPFNKYLVKYIDYLYIESDCNFSKLRNYGRETKLFGEPIKQIEVAAKDNEWLNNTAQSSLGYLLFKDKIYDMKNQKTLPFDSKIVFHHRCPHNFPERNLEDMKYAYETSFKAICGDVCENGHDISEMHPDRPETVPSSMALRVALARGLAGDIGAKKFYLCPGKTNAGKSKLVSMFMTCFGMFVQQFNAENLAHQDKNSSQDQAQKNRWALISRFARIIFSSEVNMKITLNGNDLKKVSSGGDPLIGRTHHKEEVQFVPHFTPFCMLNDIPEIMPMDEAVQKRLSYYEFPKQFVEEVEDPSYQVKFDPKLDEKIREDRFINGFIHLMLDAYKYYLNHGQPSFDLKTKEDWTSNDNKEDDIIELMYNSYEVTKNPKHYVTIADFNNFKKENKKTFEGISMKVVGELLNKIGINKGKLSSGTRVLTGLRIGVTVFAEDHEGNSDKEDN